MDSHCPPYNVITVTSACDSNEWNSGAMSLGEKSQQHSSFSMASKFPRVHIRMLGR